MTCALRIGLTGGIGSGKTRATGYFNELGVPCIDADEVSRSAVAPGQPALQEIVACFGEGVIDGKGALKRRELRGIVFADDSARKTLESIVHPRVHEEICKFIDNAAFPYCIISSPLLVEMANPYGLDRILVIDVPEELQLERASRRDDSRKEDIAKIIKSQVSRQERLEAADDIILNDRDLDYLKERVSSLHHKYMAMASNEADGKN